MNFNVSSAAYRFEVPEKSLRQPVQELQIGGASRRNRRFSFSPVALWGLEVQSSVAAEALFVEA
jgi:hypothetical protein